MKTILPTFLLLFCMIFVGCFHYQAPESINNYIGQVDSLDTVAIELIIIQNHDTVQKYFKY
jgi:hypothetical protein